MSETLSDQPEALGRVRRLATGSVGWFLLVFGVCVAAVAGIVLTRAWFAKDITNGWVGALLLLGGALVAISGGLRTGRGSPADFELLEPRSNSVIPKVPDALPRLGELLVYKYHLISERDLQRALAKQKEFAGRPVGEILVQMGRITWRDLARTLEDQLSYGDPWKRKGM